MPPQAAANDLCLVKLLVGPGNPGPADAPSTSPGIGIEVWLPMHANWNGRIHNWGGGGWVGGPAGSPTEIANTLTAGIAGDEGAVSSLTDTGHPRFGWIPGVPGGGDFAMLPDGRINETLWRDFATRSLHEQAVKTRALATLFYGRAPDHSYFEGSSQGGRQALSIAQNFPNDYDGIIGNMPAIHWTRFTGPALYAHVAYQRELGGVALTEAQLDLVSNAAIHACDVVGGQHLGYIIDQAACRYNPTQDRAVLCAADGGANRTHACVTRAQARIVNGIWYGPTSDGSVPDPANDNGWPTTIAGTRLWYGLPRGTSLYNAFYSHVFHVNAGVANPSGPNTYATDMAALTLENAAYAQPNFVNASTTQRGLWQGMTYADIARVMARGAALQAEFGHIDTSNPDLSAFQASGGRMLGWHGINDEIIPVQGTIQYYDNVLERMGGAENVQSFYRLYLVPGNGHADPNGTSNPSANPPTAPVLYDRLVNWVEHGVAPDRIDIQSPSATPMRRSQPVCPYPQQAHYVSGDPNTASSYRCE